MSSTLTLHYPSLRMAIGRFGIWLAKIGRELQVRYANWNSEFRLKFEICPNPEYARLHTSEPITEEIILSFASAGSQENKQTPLVKALFGVRGVKCVQLVPYEIGFEKSDVFSWDELRPDIERVALEHLTKS